MWVCDKFNDSTAKWFKSTTSVKVGREHLGMVPGRQCVPFSSLILRTPHQHAKKRHTANGKPASVTPNPSSSKTLSSPSRDQRPPSSRRTWQSRIRILSILHTSPRRWLQTVSFTGVYNDNDPRIYHSSMYSPIHFAQWTCVRNLALPADMTGQLSGSGLSSSPGKLVHIVHGEE